MKNKKRIISISIVAVFILITTLVIINIKSKPEVTVDKVKKDTLTKSISITGEVIANNSFTSMLNPSLKITNINFKEGDSVKKGDTLLKYDSSEIDSQLERAKLNLDLKNKLLSSAKSKKDESLEVSLPDEDFKNMSPETKASIESIIKANSLSEETIKGYEMEVELAKKDIESLKSKLSAFKISSPINGVITKLNSSEGAIANQGDILEIQDLSKMKVKLLLNQYDSTLIKSGQKANITISGIEKPLTGSVIYVSETASSQNPASNSKSIIAYISIDGDISNIKVGFEADCSIILNESNGLYVSFDSIKKDDNGTYLYTIENSCAKKTYIKTGIETDFEVEVLEGLKLNDIYIKNPNSSIKNGVEVSFKEI